MQGGGGVARWLVDGHRGPSVRLGRIGGGDEAGFSRRWLLELVAGRRRMDHLEVRVWLHRLAHFDV